MLEFYCDEKRHLVCVPYSIENLHKMAEVLEIKRHWFHGNHYDMPKRRIEEITKRCIKVRSRDIIKIMNGNFDFKRDVFMEFFNV